MDIRLKLSCRERTGPCAQSRLVCGCAGFLRVALSFHNRWGLWRFRACCAQLYVSGHISFVTIVHTHILSMSLIFFLLGGLVWLTKAPKKLKLFLTIEPFLSIILTFGGIYLMWSGIDWFRYIVVFSGILMTITYTGSAILVLWQCMFPKTFKISGISSR